MGRVGINLTVAKGRNFNGQRWRRRAAPLLIQVIPLEKRLHSPLRARRPPPRSRRRIQLAAAMAGLKKRKKKKTRGGIGARHVSTWCQTRAPLTSLDTNRDP